RVRGELVLLHMSIWEDHFRRLKGTRLPGQPQRNQISLAGRVAVDVISRLEQHRNSDVQRGAGLRLNLLQRANREYVSLRQTARQEQNGQPSQPTGAPPVS